MKKCYVVSMALLFVGLATVVYAQGPGSSAGGPPPAGGPGGFRGPGSMMGGQSGPEGFEHGHGPCFHGGFGSGAYLGLSKEQIDKMRELRDRFYNETRDLRYDMAQKRLEMRKLFMDPKTGDATLFAKQKEMSGLRQKLQDKMAQMMIEGRKILTPEQLQKLDRMGTGPGGGMGFGMMDGPMMGHGMMGGCMMGKGTW
ncbi:MAG TPA: Spy/CpxP family protein refolding chaperone [Syntrophorhabdales bacterium]|nr:Spy/CpxP family protein refolding chaperone [Syntrophorhabdales bacterium]